MLNCHCFRVHITAKKFEACQGGLKWNRSHQLPVYADDANMLGGSIHTVKKNREALLVSSKKDDLEVITGKTRDMVISAAGKYQNIKVDNKSF